MLSGKDYPAWLEGVKNKIRTVQIKAAIKVNAELLTFYWELGADIVVKQTQSKWGDGFLAQLSKDLMSEFPDVKDFRCVTLNISSSGIYFIIRTK